MARPAEALTYTVPEAAIALRLSQRTVWRQIRAGVWPTVRIGHRVLISKKVLEQWVEEHTAYADLDREEKA